MIIYIIHLTRKKRESFAAVLYMACDPTNDNNTYIEL